jgi:hypothetical protein
MLDLVRLALETDSTRIATVCISLASVTPSTIPGVKSNTHGLTHHGNRPDVIAELRKIEEAEFAELATFLTGLRGSTERGASLLDRTAVVFGTNMGSANAHPNDNLPVLLAGCGFRHGQHLAFDRRGGARLTALRPASPAVPGLPAPLHGRDFAWVLAPHAKSGLFGGDGIHLTPEGGYEVFAERLRPLLEKALGGVKRTPGVRRADGATRP